MLLGKGRRNGQNFFIPSYSDRDLDSLRFKQDLLEQITGQSVSCCRSINAQGQAYHRLQPPQIPLTRLLIQKLYRGQHKVITRSFLEELTWPGIAIWFMDRGSKTFKKRGGKIHALEVCLNTGFPKTANELILDYFEEVWGVSWGLSCQNRQQNRYRLRMGTQKGREFLARLTPYLPPPLDEQVQTSYNKTATPKSSQTWVKE